MEQYAALLMEGRHDVKEVHLFYVPSSNTRGHDETMSAIEEHRVANKQLMEDYPEGVQRWMDFVPLNGEFFTPPAGIRCVAAPTFRHSTLRDVYIATGYEPKAVTHFRRRLLRPEILDLSARAIASVPWRSEDPDIDAVLDCLISKGLTFVNGQGVLVLSKVPCGRYWVRFKQSDGEIVSPEYFKDPRLALAAYNDRCVFPHKLSSFIEAS